MEYKPKIPDYISIIVGKNIKLMSFDGIKNVETSDKQTLSKILPLLDGNNTISDISFKTKISESRIEEIIFKMSEVGLVTSPRKKNNFKLNILFVNDSSVGGHLIEKLPTYISRNTYLVKTTQYKNAITKRKYDLMISCSDGIHDSFHKDLNSKSMNLGIPWLSIRIMGERAEIGPFVISKIKTACFECYRKRLESNMEDLESFHTIAKFFDRPIRDLVITNMIVNILAGYLESEIVLFKNKIDSPKTIDGVLSLDFYNYSSNLDTFLKVPGCIHS